MTGEQLKKKIKEAGFSLSDVASLLGYENQHGFYSVLRYENVKSGVIEEVARVTNRPISWYYGEKPAKNLRGKGTKKAPSDEYPEDWQMFVDATLMRLVSETNRLGKEVCKLAEK